MMFQNWGHIKIIYITGLNSQLKIIIKNLHSFTLHLDTIESFIYPNDAQLDYSKNTKIYIEIYMRGAATCFCFPQPS
jgi:hypothetical protein